LSRARHLPDPLEPLAQGFSEAEPDKKEQHHRERREGEKVQERRAADLGRHDVLLAEEE
jgi:hypothetical protein